MAAWVALLLLVIAGVALLMRADVGSIAGYDPSDFALVVSGFALLIFIASSMVGSYRGRAGQALRDMLAWSLLGAALFAGYSYREIRQLTPGRTHTNVNKQLAKARARIRLAELQEAGAKTDRHASS